MMRKTLTSFAALALIAAPLAIARAQILIPDTPTATLFSDAASHDDEAVLRTLPFTFTFFGNNYTQVGPSTNGIIGFGSANNEIQPPLATTSAPPFAGGFADDLFITAGSGQFVEEISTPSYYATNGLEGLFGGPRTPAQVSYQIALFGATTTITKGSDSFTFLPGDIAFSYDFALASSSGTAVVGISNADGTLFTPLPGDADGTISDAQLNLLPTSGNQFILFRPTGPRTYSATIESLTPTVGPPAVPEPGALAALLGMGVPVGGLLLRRKRRA